MEMERDVRPSPHRLRLPLSTQKALYSTLPFDSGHAILFQKAANSEHDFLDRPERESRAALLEPGISGEEARQFYEEVTSLPSEPPKRRVGQKRRVSFDSPSSDFRRKTPSRQVKKKTKTRASNASVSHVFHYAQNGDLNSLTAVLSQGELDINSVDHFGWTLLMCASHAGHMDIAEYLLFSGARWRDFTDKRGHNALDLARSAGHLHIVELLERSSPLHAAQSEDGSRKSSNNHNKPDHQSHRSRTSDGGPSSKRKQKHPPSTYYYYCEICKLHVSSDPTPHSTSTVHQFSCQHRPTLHSYTIPHTNRGYQLLLREGWDPDRGLGADQQGQQYPVKTVLKQDRLGFGVALGTEARVTHFSAHDRDAVKYARERGSSGGGEKRRTKKDIVKAIEKERRWEMNMRRYMNTDLDF